jgi:hypothetical protein
MANMTSDSTSQGGGLRGGNNSSASDMMASVMQRAESSMAGDGFRPSRNMTVAARRFANMRRWAQRRREADGGLHLSEGAEVRVERGASLSLEGHHVTQGGRIRVVEEGELHVGHTSKGRNMTDYERRRMLAERESQNAAVRSAARERAMRMVLDRVNEDGAWGDSMEEMPPRRNVSRVALREAARDLARDLPEEWRGTVVMGGRLSGSGVVPGEEVVLDDGAVIAPGNSPGSQVYSGDLTMSSDTRTEIEVEGTADGEYDTIEVLGTATLDGSMDVIVADGFAAPDGWSPTVLSARVLQGSIAVSARTTSGAPSQLDVVTRQDATMGTTTGLLDSIAADRTAASEDGSAAAPSPGSGSGSGSDSESDGNSGSGAAVIVIGVLVGVGAVVGGLVALKAARAGNLKAAAPQPTAIPQPAPASGDGKVWLSNPIPAGSKLPGHYDRAISGPTASRPVASV